MTKNMASVPFTTTLSKNIKTKNILHFLLFYFFRSFPLTIENHSEKVLSIVFHPSMHSKYIKNFLGSKLQKFTLSNLHLSAVS